MTLLEIGDRGEKIARDILESIGFRFEWKILKEEGRGKPSYDLLAHRLGQKYAINVKHGTRFVIDPCNALRLYKTAKKYGYKPAFMLVINSNRYFFYSLDSQVPERIDKKNERIEQWVSI